MLAMPPVIQNFLIGLATGVAVVVEMLWLTASGDRTLAGVWAGLTTSLGMVFALWLDWDRAPPDAHGPSAPPRAPEG